MATFKQELQKLDRLRDDNQKLMFELVGMKDKRLTYQEARIEALEKHIEKQNIEILNLQFQLKQAQNAINE
jgi:hypothetical protein